MEEFKIASTIVSSRRGLVWGTSDLCIPPLVTFVWVACGEGGGVRADPSDRDGQRESMRACTAS